MLVEKERVSLLGVGDLVVTPSAGAETAVVIAEREHMRTARSTWLEAALLTPNERDDSEGGYQRALRADRVTRLNIQPLAVESLSPHHTSRRARFARYTLERTEGRVCPCALPADQFTWASPTWSVLLKTEQRAVTHGGILYRVVQVGGQHVAIGGIGAS